MISGHLEVSILEFYWKNDNMKLFIGTLSSFKIYNIEKSSS